MAVSLGRYLGTDGLVGSMAMIAGVVGGAAFVAAGAIQQETVFYALFVDSKQTGELALAAGVTDLTGFNLLISVVAGGMRSAGSYAVGLAWIGWAVIGARSGRLPRPLSVVGVIAGLGFALTNLDRAIGRTVRLSLVLWSGSQALRSPCLSGHGPSKS